MAIIIAKRMYLTGLGSETGVLGGVRIKPIGFDDGFPRRACSVVTCLCVKLNILNVL